MLNAKRGLSVPKVTGRMVQSYVGKKVSLVGKVLEPNPGMFLLSFLICVLIFVLI